MDQNYNISLTDIGLVIEKLMGGGYVSEYSKREFKYRYIRELKNRVTCLIIKIFLLIFSHF